MAIRVHTIVIGTNRTGPQGPRGPAGDAVPHNDLDGRDISGAHPASVITYDPGASGLVATDAQAAIDELASGLADKVDDDDARLTDARTPTAHASSHAPGGSDPIEPTPQDESGTSLDTDSFPHGAEVYTTATSAVTLTANQATGGKRLTFVQAGSGGQITVSAGSGVTLRYPSAFTPKTAEQWSIVVLRWRSSTEVHVSGDLEAA